MERIERSKNYEVERGPLPGLGEVPVDRQFRLRIETHPLV